MNERKHVKDLINDDYKKWSKGSVIPFPCVMNSGKTTFILNTLGPYVKALGKKIRYVINRTYSKNDIEKKVSDAGLKGTIMVQTYQSIQEGMKRNIPYTITDYTVYDEAHYYFNEAWNGGTDKMFEFFEKTKKNTVSIFMTGTGDGIFNYLLTEGFITKDSLTRYGIDADYSYIENVHFWNTQKYITDKIDSLKLGEKMLVFCSSTETAYKLHKKYENNSYFMCSKNNPDKFYVQQSNNDCIVNDKFDRQILFTTSVLAEYKDLKDKDLKYIVTDFFDFDMVQQCISRKRPIDSSDTVTVYIKDYLKKNLNGLKRTLRNNILKDAELYLTNKSKFMENIKNDPKMRKRALLNPCFNLADEDEIKLDFKQLKYNYYKHREDVIANLIEDGDDLAFSAFAIRLLCKYGLSAAKNDPDAERDLVKIKDNQKLFKYLDGLVGKRLFKEEQKELINEINVRVNGHQQKTWKKLNKGLEMERLPFTILPRKSGDTRYWVVETISI